MTRHEALAVYRRHGLLLAQMSVREDVAVKLEELCRERDDAREDQERQRYRLATIIDETFGMQEHLPTDALLTLLERKLFEWRMELRQAIAARDEWARQCAMASEHQVDTANAAAGARAQLQDACVALNRVALALYDCDAESPALEGVRAVLEVSEWTP